MFGSTISIKGFLSAHVFLHIVNGEAEFCLPAMIYGTASIDTDRGTEC
jgi:hypothetical protein